ncbi:MBL fold metallo-hydrolase [Desulfosediminicola ganghwensis]|uniref:MBL fold metallo-hydrolase n=1 Tax=Desulfosediminicola ganghwensis TaxID=2569540 RepID=UPI001E2AA124|nr:MBL fold metallo-hydrolase [Desulfosediminicola ganghwensis]
MSLPVIPVWWPFLVAASPVILPLLYRRNLQFSQDRESAQKCNRARIEQAGELNLPELEKLSLSAVVEQKAASGFVGSPAVCYLLESDLGTLLFDVGYGPEDDAMAVNSKKMGLADRVLDGVAISHLHPDHMGGFAAAKKYGRLCSMQLGK